LVAGWRLIVKGVGPLEGLAIRSRGLLHAVYAFSLASGAVSTPLIQTG